MACCSADISLFAAHQDGLLACWHGDWEAMTIDLKAYVSAAAKVAKRYRLAERYMLIRNDSFDGVHPDSNPVGPVPVTYSLRTHF